MKCRCNCGYRCGGPGVCKDPDCGWGTETDGKEHFTRDCDHVWDGESRRTYDVGGAVTGASVTCSRCAMSAMSHDCAVGP
jgi:hypothetical protein